MGDDMSEKVKIYTSPTCLYCKMAKDFFSERGVEYVEIDVTRDKKALEEMKHISGGARSVPVISICNDVMVGFDRERVEHSLKCLEQSTEV